MDALARRVFFDGSGRIRTRTAEAAAEIAFADFKTAAPTWEATAAVFSIVDFKNDAAASTPTARTASRPLFRRMASGRRRNQGVFGG